MKRTLRTLCVPVALFSAAVVTTAEAGQLATSEIQQIEQALGLQLSGTEIQELGAIVKPDSQAAWRRAAEQRIAAHRQADLAVRVVDPAGRPVEGAEVRIRQLRNAFRFGGVCTVADLTDGFGNLAAEGSTTAEWENIVRQLFNAVGLNNGFKPKITGQHAYIPGFMDWAGRNGLDVRAHLLMWPGGGHLDGNGNLAGTPGADYGNHLSTKSTSAYASHNVLGAVESWAKADSRDRAARALALEQEVDAEIREWAGRWDVYEWDVINESVGNTLLQEILGWDRMARWFRLAVDNSFRSLNPGASRYADTGFYINEFKIASAKPNALDGGAQYAWRRGRFMDRIDRVIADGGPVNGIGLQSRYRFGPVDPDEVYGRIDEFAQRYEGFRMAGTEFEIKDGADYRYTEQQRARMTEELLTVYYSHPRMTGLNAWDFMSPSSDSDPTEVTAALAWYDGTIKMNGLVWYYLHRIRYHTDVTRVSGPAGVARAAAFKGDYEVTVRVDGETHTANVSLEDDRELVVTVNRPFEINAGMTDAWYQPETDGQGFLVTVFPEIRQLFVGWYTYETERPPEGATAVLGEAGHRWLTAQGPYEGDTADLDLHLTAGGVFDRTSPPAVTLPEPVGRLLLRFDDCTVGSAFYDLPGLGLRGVIPIRRITDDNVPLCRALSTAAAE